MISKNLIKNADSLLALNQLTPAIKIYEKAYYLNKSVPLSKLIVPLLLQQKEKSTLKAIAYLTDFESLTVKEFAIVKQSIDDKYKNYFYYTILLKDTTIQFNQIKFERNEPELWKKVLKFKNQHKSTKHKHLS